MSVRSWSYRTSGSTSFTVTAPPDMVEGDRLIAVIFTDSDPADAIGTPSGGWSPLAQADDEADFTDGDFTGTYGLHTRVWHKKATGSEPATYRFTQADIASAVVIIVAVATGSSATPRCVVTTQRNSSSVVTPSATLPSGTGTELRFAGATAAFGADASWTAPAGLTRLTPSLQGDEFTNGVGLARDLDHSGATGTFTVDSHWTQDFLHGVTVVVPDVSGGGTSPTVPPPTIPALPSDEQVVHYTYVFADLLTDEDIAKDLDLYNVTYDRRISEPGPFSATVDIVDEVTAAKVARIVPRHATDLSTGPGRTVVHVYRNGVVWGTYVIWSAAISRSSRDQPIQVRLDGTSLESYLSQVKVRDDLSYESEDQIDIARALIDNMQGTARYNIGLQLLTGTSGVTTDLAVAAADSTTYGEVLGNLAEVENGFEWMITVVDNEDGTRTRTWVWGHPTIGSDATSHKFQEPGNVLSWTERVDALRGGTAWQARGDSTQTDGSETSQPTVSNIILADDWIDAGWPGIDKTVDRSGVTDTDVLNAVATWSATALAGAVRVHQATVRLPANSSFGPGNLGDQVTLMLVNPWWPIEDGVASFSKTWRVVGMSFKPPAKGAGQEECVLTFEEAGSQDGG